MKARALFLALLFMSAGQFQVVAAMVADSTPQAFDIDTSGSAHAVTSMDAISLPYWVGDTITVTAPDGSVSTPVSKAATAGVENWIATMGGVWTITNSDEGTATFSVRYSLFGEQGAGTEADPAKIVDNDELHDLVLSGTAGDGYMFVLQGSAVSFGTMTRINGYAVVPLGNGVYRLMTASDGRMCDSLAVEFPIDTISTGPTRKVAAKEDVLPFAYSGDSWNGDPTAASTLTFTSPSGNTTIVPCTGTGAYAFTINQGGTWTVTLAAGGTELTGMVKLAKGFVLSVH